MDISLKPQLTEDEVGSLKRYLSILLKSDRLSSNVKHFPVPGKIALYINHSAYVLLAGDWDLQWRDRVLVVGRDTSHMRLDERLAVIASIISLLGAWGDFIEDYSKAMTKILFTQYQHMMDEVVVAQALPTGLAFNQKEAKMAAEINGIWVAPNGEPMKVEGADWAVAR